MWIFEWNFIGGLTDDPNYPDGSVVRVIADTEVEARSLANSVLPPGILDDRAPFRMPAMASEKGVTVIP